MPITTAVRAPWTYSLSQGQHDLVFYSLVVAGLALFAQFVRTWVSVDEVSPRYRSALYAGLCICGVAFLAYLYLVVKFDSSYVLRAGRYVPTSDSINTYVPRYMDWSVTVPLLMVEALAVGGLVGARARSTRLVLVSAAFLMIFTGFLGADVLGGGTSRGWLLLWGIISTVFYIVLYVVLFGVLRSAKSSLGAESYASYRNALVLLLSVWGWYPIAFALHNWLPGAHWTVVEQVGFSAADIIAKVGFGSLIHKIAKLRTAEDVVAGTSTHPQEVWVSSVKKSDGVQPTSKDVADGSLTGTSSGSGARGRAPAATAATPGATSATATDAPRRREPRRR